MRASLPCAGGRIRHGAWRIAPGPTPGSALLKEEDEAPPLADSDQPFAEGTEEGWRVESDLAPYKPLCDVLLDAQAVAPHSLACACRCRPGQTARKRAPS